MALRKNNIILYKRIQEEFHELFSVKRLQYDYCLELLGIKHCKAPATIGNIIRTDLPTELPKANPNQTELFLESHRPTN